MSKLVEVLEHLGGLRVHTLRCGKEGDVGQERNKRLGCASVPLSKTVRQKGLTSTERLNCSISAMSGRCVACCIVLVSMICFMLRWRERIKMRMRDRVLVDSRFRPGQVRKAFIKGMWHWPVRA